MKVLNSFYSSPFIDMRRIKDFLDFKEFFRKKVVSTNSILEDIRMIFSNLIFIFWENGYNLLIGFIEKKISNSGFIHNKECLVFKRFSYFR
jgi:hypothetical protein